MKLSIFTDEINSDPTRALELVKAWDIKAVEIRGLKGVVSQGWEMMSYWP